MQENKASSRFGLRAATENFVPQVTKPLAQATSQSFSIYCDENDVPNCNESLSTTAAKAADSLYSAFNLPAATATTSTSLAPEKTKLRKPLTVLSSISIDIDDESTQSCKCTTLLQECNLISVT